MKHTVMFFSAKTSDNILFPETKILFKLELHRGLHPSTPEHHTTHCSEPHEDSELTVPDKYLQNYLSTLAKALL